MTYGNTVWVLLTDASRLSLACFKRVFVLESADGTLVKEGTLLCLVSYDDLFVVFWLMVGHDGLYGEGEGVVLF